MKHIKKVLFPIFCFFLLINSCSAKAGLGWGVALNLMAIPFDMIIGLCLYQESESRDIISLVDKAIRDCSWQGCDHFECGPDEIGTKDKVVAEGSLDFFGKVRLFSSAGALLFHGLGCLNLYWWRKSKKQKDEKSLKETVYEKKKTSASSCLNC